MVMAKRWFIREDIDQKKFAQAIKKNKDFTLERQKDILKFVFAIKLDKFMAPGVKRKRIRKKHVKRDIALAKRDLEYRVLDMLIYEWREIPDTPNKLTKEIFDRWLNHHTQKAA